MLTTTNRYLMDLFDVYVYMCLCVHFKQQINFFDLLVDFVRSKLPQNEWTNETLCFPFGITWLFVVTRRLFGFWHKEIQLSLIDLSPLVCPSVWLGLAMNSQTLRSKFELPFPLLLVTANEFIAAHKTTRRLAIKLFSPLIETFQIILLNSYCLSAHQVHRSVCFHEINLSLRDKPMTLMSFRSIITAQTILVLNGNVWKYVQRESDSQEMCRRKYNILYRYHTTHILSHLHSIVSSHSEGMSSVCHKKWNLNILTFLLNVLTLLSTHGCCARNGWLGDWRRTH